MKVLTVFGTRPEIIRLSEMIRRLDSLCEHVLVHTGQNWDENLSGVFFRELGIRKPDRHLGIESQEFAEQISKIFTGVSGVMDEVRPDRVLILGDTNSGLAAIVAARRGVPVFHVEAGNRCYDDRVPEEINRRIIDHCSAVLMPYTQRSKDNLVREGIGRERIFVVGNPIKEVLDAHDEAILRSDVLGRLDLVPKGYFLATLHRAENVDSADRLSRILQGIERVGARLDRPVVVSVHPRTADRIHRAGLQRVSRSMRLIDPLGFFDFVALERESACVLTDSGTVQEECCILAIPSVTLRDVTERPETMECGGNILSGCDPDDMERATRVAVSLPTGWSVPTEYLERNVSSAVSKILLGYHANLPSSRAGSGAINPGVVARPAKHPSTSRS